MWGSSPAISESSSKDLPSDTTRGGVDSRRWLRSITARKNGYVASSIPKFAREFFYHRRLARAADCKVADGDDLNAERGVAQDTEVVEEAAEFNRDSEQF
jgi:hypothetical protein